jgi:hypothetical protein
VTILSNEKQIQLYLTPTELATLKAEAAKNGCAVTVELEVWVAGALSRTLPPPNEPLPDYPNLNINMDKELYERLSLDAAANMRSARAHCRWIIQQKLKEGQK